MIKKIKNYYDIYGFKQTIYKIIRYLKFMYQSKSKKTGAYKLNRYEKNNITLKNKQMFIFANNSYNNKNNYSKLSNYYNLLGYSVYYIYIKKDDENERKKPLVYYKSLYKLKPKECKFDDDTLVIFENKNLKFKEYFEKAKINKSIIVVNPFKTNLNQNKKNAIWVKRELNNQKCDAEFYNNISIIILNHNNLGIINKCIDTLIENKKKYEYEIIVVDNQSNDGSYENLKQKYKNRIKLIRNIKNGCSSGRNLGVNNSSKDYIVFLDSDQWVINNSWLDNYINIFLNKKNVGAIGWTAGWFNRNGYAYHTVDDFEYRYMPPQGLYRSDIGYLGSGGMMISKKFFNKIGGFDEKYDPTCYEDTDLSLNIRNHGKELIYCPYLGIKHLPHQTTKSGSDKHRNLIQEKGKYFVKKWKEKNKKLLKYIK